MCDNKILNIVSDSLEDVQKALMIVSKMQLFSSRDRLKIKSVTPHLIVLKPTDDLSTLKFEHYDVKMLESLYKKLTFKYDPSLGDKDLGWHDSQEEAYQLSYDDSTNEISLRLSEIGYSK